MGGYHFVTADGRKVAYASKTQVVESGTQEVNLTFDDLLRVEYLLSVVVKTNPVTTAHVETYSVDARASHANVVGMTLSVGAGTTLTVEGWAVGY